MSYGCESLDLDLDDTTPVAGAGLAVAGAARGAAVPDGVASRQGGPRLLCAPTVYGCSDAWCGYRWGAQTMVTHIPARCPLCGAAWVADPPRPARAEQHNYRVRKR